MGDGSRIRKKLVAFIYDVIHTYANNPIRGTLHVAYHNNFHMCMACMALLQASRKVN